MDNQHREIVGYKELSADAIDKVNRVKYAGVGLNDLIRGMERDSDCDHRWVNEGKMLMQQALMALTRSITKPDFL